VLEIERGPQAQCLELLAECDAVGLQLELRQEEVDLGAREVMAGGERFRGELGYQSREVVRSFWNEGHELKAAAAVGDGDGLEGSETLDRFFGR
jgi:hypothetical protein